jgi:hypothetical protein
MASTADCADREALNAGFVPWARGFNGGASAASSILAMVRGISGGFPAVTVGGHGVSAAGVIAIASIGRGERPAARNGTPDPGYDLENPGSRS